MNFRLQVLLCTWFLASVVTAGDPFPIQPALVEGDSVPGVGVVEVIDNVAINDLGEWLVEANTDFANTDEDQVLINTGMLLLREGIGGLDAPLGAVVDSFDSVSISNSGAGGFNFFLDPFPTSEDSGVYIDNMLQIQESNISKSPDFSPGTAFIGFFDVKINNNDDLMIVASVDDPIIASSVDRALVVVDSATGTQTVVAKEGDILPGQTEVVDDFGTGPHESAFNDNGEILYVVELSGDTATDTAIYLNNTLIAQEGSASPLAGRSYEFLSSRGIDVNNKGESVFKANLTGNSADDEVIVKNNTIFKQEGGPAPGGFALTGFGTNSGPVKIGNGGQVLWFGEWDDPNTDVNSGLFLDNTLLVQEGVTSIDGSVVDTINSGSDAFSLSSNGDWVIFEASLVGGINGAFVIQVANTMPPPNDNYFGLQVFFPISETGTNVNATTEVGEQQLDTTGSTVWWFFIAPDNGMVTIDTFGSDFDTQLHIYDGFFNGATVADLNPVVNNDDADPGTFQSQVSFAVKSGTCYDIRIGGWHSIVDPPGSPGAEGNIFLNGTFTLCDFALGDIDQSGSVDLLDVAPFVALIATSSFQCEADVNEDGNVDLLDVDPFVDILAGGGG